MPGWKTYRPVLASLIVVVALTGGIEAKARASRERLGTLADAERLNLQVLTLYRQGRYAEAIEPARRALAIREQNLGPNHPGVAASLHNLAVLYHDMGSYSQALPLYKRALAIHEKALGPNHPYVAGSLNNLAGLYYDMGSYFRALPLFQRALAIREKALGPNHPDVAASLNNLAVLLAATGQVGRAFDLMFRAQKIDVTMVEQVMGFGTEDQSTRFLVTRQPAMFGFLSLAAQHFPTNTQVVRSAFSVWLRRKGTILKAQRRFFEALFKSDNPEVIKALENLTAIRARLARLILDGRGKMTPETYRKILADLDRKREALESRLMRLSQPYAAARRSVRATVAHIARALPAGTVMLEIARVRYFNFKAKRKQPRWLPAHYLAFVIPAGRTDKVALIDLGPAEPIDRTVAALKKSIMNLWRPKAAAALARKLHDLVFAPVKSRLGGARTIYVSPDGSLSLIPFEVLQGPDGRYLIEHYTFNYLAAGRDLLRFGMVKAKAGLPLIMGAPDFNLSPEAKRAVLAKMGLKAPATPLPVPEDIRRHPLPSLGQARAEIKAVATRLKAPNGRVFVGSRALKQVLLRVGSPRILHLATHGTFLEDIACPSARRLRGVGGVVSIGQFHALKKPQPSRPLPHRVFDPLLRSRLFLAGANRDGDSILTAADVLTMRLQGTDLVVLSACQTGLGQVKTGEGVYGLRRAFVQAGAKSLIMSLWAVPDRETRELMAGLYANLVKGKLDRCQALRQAVLRQMRVVKKRYGHAHPFYWAAFVFLGEK